MRRRSNEFSYNDASIAKRKSRKACQNAKKNKGKRGKKWHYTTRKWKKKKASFYGKIQKMCKHAFPCRDHLL